MGHLPHSGAPNPWCYAPGPRAGGPRPRGMSKPGNARPNPSTTASSPSSCPAPCPRSRSSPSGRASPACGATASTRCAPTSRAFRRPSPTRSSPATAGRATSSSTRSAGRGTAPLQATAEGRIGVGNDLNPLAQILTAAKVDPGAPRRGAHAPRGAAARLGRRRAGLARARRARRRPSRPPVRARARRRARAAGPDAADGAGPRRGRTRVPPADARPAAVPPQPPRPRRPRRPLPRWRARGDPPRQDAQLPVHDHAQHVQHGAALRPRLRGDRTATSRPSATRSTPCPRSSTACTASRLPGADRDRARRATPGPPAAAPAPRSGPRPAGPRTPRRSRRRRTCGCSSTATTTGSGPGSWASTPARSTPSSTTPTTASRSCAFMREVLADLRPALTDDGIAVLVIGDVEMDRGKPSAERPSASPSGSGRRRRYPAGYRLAGLVRDEVAANRKMTRLWGEEAGRATKTDRILVLGATEAGRRRALAGADLPIDWTWPPTRLRAICNVRPVPTGRRARAAATRPGVGSSRRPMASRLPPFRSAGSRPRALALPMALVALAVVAVVARPSRWRSASRPRCRIGSPTRPDVLSAADEAEVAAALAAARERARRSSCSSRTSTRPAVEDVHDLDRGHRRRRARSAATTRCSLVAIEDRTYAMWVGDAAQDEVTDEERTRSSASAVEPLLVDGDFAGGRGRRRARRLGEASAATVVPTAPPVEADAARASPRPRPSGGLNLTPVLAVLLLIGGGFLVGRIAARPGARRSDGAKATHGQAGNGDANRALLATDEALKDAANDVEFAAAQWGEEEVTAYRLAIAQRHGRAAGRVRDPPAAGRRGAGAAARAGAMLQRDRRARTRPRAAPRRAGAAVRPALGTSSRPRPPSSTRSCPRSRPSRHAGTRPRPSSTRIAAAYAPSAVDVGRRQRGRGRQGARRPRPPRRTRGGRSSRRSARRRVVALRRAQEAPRVATRLIEAVERLGRAARRGRRRASPPSSTPPPRTSRRPGPASRDGRSLPPLAPGTSLVPPGRPARAARRRSPDPSAALAQAERLLGEAQRAAEARPLDPLAALERATPGEHRPRTRSSRGLREAEAQRSRAARRSPQTAVASAHGHVDAGRGLHHDAPSWRGSRGPDPRRRGPAAARGGAAARRHRSRRRRSRMRSGRPSSPTRPTASRRPSSTAGTRAAARSRAPTRTHAGAAARPRSSAPCSAASSGASCRAAAAAPAGAAARGAARPAARAGAAGSGCPAAFGGRRWGHRPAGPVRWRRRVGGGGGRVRGGRW